MTFRAQGVASDMAVPSPRAFASVPRAPEDRGAEAGALRRELGALRNEVRLRSSLHRRHGGLPHRAFLVGLFALV